MMGCGLLLGESALGAGPLGGNGRSSETSVLAHDSSANMSIQSNVGIMAEYHRGIAHANIQIETKTAEEDIQKM